ncbi:hypothetical protein ABPG72_018410 [Tetrahymena utriculariae]
MFKKLLQSTFNKVSAPQLTTQFMKHHFSYLVGNVPPTDVYVRKEYVTQFEEGHGELEEGVWITVKSKKDRAFLFETLFTEYGALYDKLPISAFLWKKDVDFDNLLPLDYLQLWNCFSYDFTVVNKVNIASLRCEVLMKNGKTYPGQYLFTIDHTHSDPGILNTAWSEIPHEHKSFNIIKLDNGQFCAQPNNRIKWKQSSLIPVQTKSAKFFKVCEIDYQVEDTPKWSVADTSDYYYKENSEQKAIDESNQTTVKQVETKTSPTATNTNSTHATTNNSTANTQTNNQQQGSQTEQHKNRVRRVGSDIVNFAADTSKPY